MQIQIARLQFITQGETAQMHINQVEKALEGGCQWVQLRMKDFDEETILKVARDARELTREVGATLIINDRVDIAKAVKADGVHLGKNDIAPPEARAILGNHFIIGATANTFGDIEKIIRQPVDYIGVGPFRFTETKKNLSPVIGLEGYAKRIEQCQKAKINIPMVAIGSIGNADVEDLLKTGMYGIAISSAIANAVNPIEATRELINPTCK
ncbi:MAG: thiamine phosphate synthase [Prolixibacteraceae bacterium]|jgi:thiamine-phosphate pyrophosphorylase|nr:thiamine phosphate synthase [Prolixibacteraceae bacterium]